MNLATSLKNGRRDLGKGANDRRRVRSLKDSKIGTLVDGKRMAIVSGKSKKSRIAPHRDVSHRGVKILIDVVLVAQKGRKDKNLGTGERSHHRDGEGATASGARGGKNAGGGGRSSAGSIIFLF